MTHERCTVCRSVLLWSSDRLICPNPQCPGGTLTMPSTKCRTLATSGPAPVRPPGTAHKTSVMRSARTGVRDDGAEIESGREPIGGRRVARYRNEARLTRRREAVPAMRLQTLSPKGAEL